MTSEAIGGEIISVATRFLNLYEVKSNELWDNPDTAGVDPEGHELNRMMKECGWQPGWPYCAAFCEAVWRAAYRNLGAPASLIKEIAEKLTPSVMQSFNNWGSSRISRQPLPGSIFFMQKGKSGKGHAGLVVKPGTTHFASIEGNTSPDPKDAEADREGDGIFRRTRSLDFSPKTGLWLRGFLNPIDL
ncbi:MAG: hypothetical protein MUF52_11020 [Syntrophobacteraceae bacterium]|jgi:hypothetical protein|nr:hypothetical protein [Syntrophobacteraceae bacterium]